MQLVSAMWHSACSWPSHIICSSCSGEAHTTLQCTDPNLQMPAGAELPSLFTNHSLRIQAGGQVRTTNFAAASPLLLPLLSLASVAIAMHPVETCCAAQLQKQLDQTHC